MRKASFKALKGCNASVNRVIRREFPSPVSFVSATVQYGVFFSLFMYYGFHSETALVAYFQ